MKDNFSKQSLSYKKFRPSYPQAIFEFIYQQLESKTMAWDCGTGNGQFAVELAKQFDKVIATDLSTKQIENATPRSNIEYQVLSAETAEFPQDSFDLITVAQAAHWFDFDKFYKVVNHCLKPEGLLALITYNLLEIDAETDQIVGYLYKDILGKYWDPERKYVDSSYETIPFPFEEIETPKFTQTYHWQLEDLIGYLNTWSAVQHYINDKGTNPVDLISNELVQSWQNGTEKEVTFPMFMRLGKKR